MFLCEQYNLTYSCNCQCEIIFYDRSYPAYRAVAVARWDWPTLNQKTTQKGWSFGLEFAPVAVRGAEAPLTPTHTCTFGAHMGAGRAEARLPAPGRDPRFYQFAVRLLLPLSGSLPHPSALPKLHFRLVPTGIPPLNSSRSPDLPSPPVRTEVLPCIAGSDRSPPPLWWDRAPTLPSFPGPAGPEGLDCSAPPLRLDEYYKAV